jgi:YidC/Oxa1 family membrane protein insertase
MQRMQPLVRELQRKHKGNRQKIAEETMALYREHGVNQFGGCLPVLLQLPLLLALYQALIRASGVVTGFTVNDGNRQAFEVLQDANVVTAVSGQANTYQVAFEGACNLPEYSQLPQFLPLNCQLIDPIHLESHVNTTVSWLLNPITGVHLDLAQIDNVFALNMGVFSLSAIAVVAAILQFVQVKMTSAPANPDDPTAGMTNTMMYTFPLLTIFWGGLFPSGLILYWVVYTAYLIVQQYFIMGWGNLFPLFGWRPAFAGAASVAAPPPIRGGAAEEKAGTNQPVNPRPQSGGGGGGRAGSRPANRRSGAKRRGRRRR